MALAGSYRRSFWQRLALANEGCRPEFAFKLCLFEEGFSLLVFGYFLPLTFLNRWAYEPHEIMESWGFNLCDRTIQLYWGRHCKVVHLPWDWHHMKCEVMRPDGSWTPYVPSYERDKESDGRWQKAYPYRYVLRNGDVQERTATIYVERREWRWRWFIRLPWPAKKQQCIDVEFSEEVGEKAGSWKGGCIGCAYEMRPGEHPLATLRRMESERKF